MQTMIIEAVKNGVLINDSKNTIRINNFTDM